MGMELGRGLAHQLFEIEVEGIAAYKQGLLGQGIDGVRQQIALTDQRDRVIDAQHIDVLPICKIAVVLEKVLQMALRAVQLK
jgi:hypothetical protein